MQLSNIRACLKRDSNIIGFRAFVQSFIWEFCFDFLIAPVLLPFKFKNGQYRLRPERSEGRKISRLFLDFLSKKRHAARSEGVMRRKGGKGGLL